MKPIISLLWGLVVLAICHLTAWADISAPPQNIQLQIGSIPTTKSITQYGITWTFAEPVPFGQFVNGDFWVVGPVTITGFSPASINNGTGRIINGSQINPVPTIAAQGYDSSMAFNTYSSGLNVAFGVSSGSPLIVPINSSIISTISHPIAANTPQLQTAAVLTVVSSPPPAGSFRPCYTGSDKSIKHNESDINYSVLKSITPTASAPTLASSASQFAKLWLDYKGSTGGRMIHPIDNMPNYGREMSTASGEAALLLNCNFTNTEKRDLLVSYLQWGIDTWGVIQAGFGGWWQDGGHGGGRKFPILFAGVVLGDSSMAAVGDLPYNNPAFGEDQTTIYMTEYEAKRWIGSDGKYPANNIDREKPDAYYTQADWTYVNKNGQIGIPEYSKWNGSVYQGRWISRRHDASYRECCHANGFTGWIMAVHIMGIKGLWKHDALFDYADRYVDWSVQISSPGWYIHYSGFASEMWNTYRKLY